MIKDKQKITFEDQDIYVGIDVHKNSWTVAICTQHRCYRPFTLSPPGVEDLVEYLETHFPRGFYLCAYEAGFSGFNLCEALFDYGITIPAVFDNSGRWSRPFIQWLYQLQMPTPNATAVLQHQMGQLIYCLGMKRNVEQWLRQLSRTETYQAQADLLETVPGIGRLTAIKFQLQLGPINHFFSLDALSSYVGLVPASRNSGETTRQSRITQRGHTQLRTMLIEAAWVAIGVDPALSHCFAELKKRMPAQKAIVRIAKKLLARIRFVLINETPYEKGILA